MDTENLNRFHNLLTNERNRLIQNSKASLQNDLNISSDDLPDEVDLAASEINQSLTFELRNRERLMISKINTALQKIQEGTFGLCEVCEEEIERRRLEARPFSTCCVSCQEQNEHKEKIYA